MLKGTIWATLSPWGLANRQAATVMLSQRAKLNDLKRCEWTNIDADEVSC
jgi:hypothetical protein